MTTAARGLRLTLPRHVQTDYCQFYDRRDPCLHILPPTRHDLLRDEPSIGTERYLYPPRRHPKTGEYVKAQFGEPFCCGRHVGAAERAIREQAQEGSAP